MRCKAVPYLIEIRKLNARSTENLTFGQFDGTTPLRTALKKILQNQHKYTSLKLQQKTYKIELDGGNDGALTGRIQAGDFGQAGDIIDATNGGVSYSKKKNESLMVPFYFYMVVPDGEKRGIVVLQQTGLHGVKGIFETAVKGMFEKMYPDHRMHVRQLTIRDALKGYLEDGNIEEITAEKHEIPADIADRYCGVRQTFPGRFSISIQSKGNILKKDGFVAFSKGERELADIFEYDDLGFDVVKLKLRIGSETRYVNLTKPDAISSSIDVTDSLKFDSDGHPTKASLRYEFENVAKDLAERGGIYI